MVNIEPVLVGELNYLTLSPGWFATVWNSPGSHFVGRPKSWFRAAPWLDTDNSPGTTITIGDSASTGRAGEALWVNDDGSVSVAITVFNTGQSTAAIGIEWLEAID